MCDSSYMVFCYDEETVTVKDTEVFNYTVELLEQLDYEKRKLVFKFINMLNED